jgi:hypothetical protein
MSEGSNMDNTTIDVGETRLANDKLTRIETTKVAELEDKL